MIRFSTLLTALLVLLAGNPSNAMAQKSKKKKGAPMEAPKPPAPNAPTIESKIKKCVKIGGLFTFYQDTTTGSLMMLIKKEQIGKEFIYFSYVENGIAQTGHFRGNFRDNKVFRIKRYYNQIEFVTENTSFYFDPMSPLSKSADANISPGTMVSEKIAAADESKGLYLIEADNIFQSEAMHQIKPAIVPGFSAFMFSLGMLNKSKTKYLAVKSYPENADVVVKYIYDNPSPIARGGSDVTDSRYVEITLQHSFIQLPDNDYKPRFDDPRVGYFAHNVNDMTTTGAVNYRDMIHRWHLVKKDPSVAVSEPVKPITWWIEKTTPTQFRKTIKNAVESWNTAFEKAGFKNAVVVYEQADTATWEAGDIRYNVLRWTSSPNPPFGGYGPSFVNPRTGEILGADVMLEWVFVTNRLQRELVFSTAGLSDYNEQHFDAEHPHQFCSAGHYLHQQNLLGVQALKIMGATDVSVNEMLEQSLYYLLLHEVGHTLGLNHNMKASQMLLPAQLNDNDIVASKGLIGSVMDYPAIHFDHKNKTKVYHYTNRPGPYDMWAIEFGYSTSLSDPQAEAKRMAAILNRSTEPDLIFGNDADDMRAPGKGIDPRVMVNDLSGDAITYSIERIQFIQSLMGTLKSKFVTEGKSYHELRNAYLILSSEHATMAGIISRFIGGVYVDRSFAGQNTSNKPYTPVSMVDQKRAMKALNDFVFSPDAFAVQGDLAAYLQQQRRGFNFFATTEDPKLHDRTLMIQQSVLFHLLSRQVLQRITDSKVYGNQYQLTEFFKDLTASVFASDWSGTVNSYRQNLQVEYTSYLIAIASNDESNRYDNISKAKAYSQLVFIQKNLKTFANAGSDDSKEHKNYLLHLINQAFEK